MFPNIRGIWTEGLRFSRQRSMLSSSTSALRVWHYFMTSQTLFYLYVFSAQIMFFLLWEILYERHIKVGIREDRSRFRAPPMPAHRYVEEKSLAVILAGKRPAGVTPDLNLGERVTCMPLPSANKAAHSGFETQRRYHQKPKTGVSVARQKDVCR